MIHKLARIYFLIECLLLVSFILVTSPLGAQQKPLVNASPATLNFVVFGGYCWLALGVPLYISAIIATLKNPIEFWRGFMPPALGLAVLIWGGGKLMDSTGVLISLLYGIVAIPLTWLVLNRSNKNALIILSVAYPIIFFSTADVAFWSGFINEFIGVFLLCAPITLKIRAR